MVTDVIVWEIAKKYGCNYCWGGYFTSNIAIAITIMDHNLKLWFEWLIFDFSQWVDGQSNGLLDGPVNWFDQFQGSHVDWDWVMRYMSSDP